MKCDFMVGQRVVCIDDDWPDWGLVQERFQVPMPSRVPMINEVLTIAAIRAGTKLLTKHIVWLYFQEIEHGWSYRAFRPLIERKTDISMFTRLLSPADRLVDA